MPTLCTSALVTMQILLPPSNARAHKHSCNQFFKKKTTGNAHFGPLCRVEFGSLFPKLYPLLPRLGLGSFLRAHGFVSSVFHKLVAFISLATDKKGNIGQAHNFNFSVTHPETPPTFHFPAIFPFASVFHGWCLWVYSAFWALVFWDGLPSCLPDLWRNSGT